MHREACLSVRNYRIRSLEFKLTRLWQLLLKDAQKTILFLVAAVLVPQPRDPTRRLGHYDSEASLPTTNKGSGMCQRLPAPAAKQFGPTSSKKSTQIIDKIPHQKHLLRAYFFVINRFGSRFFQNCVDFHAGKDYFAVFPALWDE